MNRRESLQMLGLSTAALVIPQVACSRNAINETRFRYCLNTSTISGQKLGLKATIETAARAGYDSLELWVRDIQGWLEEGNSLSSLAGFIKDNGLEVANAIGFAPWMSDDDELSKRGFEQMRREMEMMAELGCIRIAAPAAGEFRNPEINLFHAGERYRLLLELGRQTGVMPQLEFWGASKVLYHMGQALMIAAVANDADARLLPDVYHMFRGGSGYNSLKMIQGHTIEIFHINDFPAHITRTEQKDADRVYPGDGAAPLKQIIEDLKSMGGVKYLSLELFNPDYWQQDALTVAKTGLEKIRQFV
jgi:2-keto-myo-inositol isomerase